MYLTAKVRKLGLQMHWKTTLILFFNTHTIFATQKQRNVVSVFAPVYHVAVKCIANITDECAASVFKIKV